MTGWPAGTAQCVICGDYLPATIDKVAASLDQNSDGPSSKSSLSRRWWRSFIRVGFTLPQLLNFILQFVECVRLDALDNAAGSIIGQ
jgi:hypothetical protein